MFCFGTNDNRKHFEKIAPGEKITIETVAPPVRKPYRHMVWQIGQGKVFYFRPGHEDFPVFKQAEMIQILSNACHWLGKK